jgi:carbamoyl-phosphate synthase large subunit
VAEVVDVLREHFPDLRTVVAKPEHDGGFEASEADVSRLRELVGWTPPHAIENGIPLLIEHERGHRPASAVPSTAGPGGVLVTSVARKVPLLRAVRAALDDVGREGAELHGGDLDPHAVGRHFVDRFWAMPPLSQLAVETAIDYCSAHGIALIVPTRDGELEFWARQRAELAAAGVDVLVSDPEAVATCLDKLRFAEALRAAGEPAIPTATSPDELGAERLVVKERFGAGAAAVALDVDPAAAREHARGLDDPIFQPYVAGDEFSLDLYAARDGTCLGVVARRREVVIGGESQVTATVRDPALERLGERLARVLGLRGHAVLQVIVAGGEHHVIECNPRFGGASTLAVAAGLATFEWAYLEALGESLESRPFVRRERELRQVRFPQDTVLPAD